MARLLSDECIAWAKQIASGVPCSEVLTDYRKDPAEALKDIAIELLVLDASHEEKGYIITDTRKTHRNAYKPWTLQ